MGQRILQKTIWVCGVVLMVGTAGCGHTMSGVKEDAATDTQKATSAANDAAAKTAAAATQAADKTTAAARQVGAAVKAVPENAAAAATLTPLVKTAMIRDPVLNDARNVINVQSADGVTHLSGHVFSESMKPRATEDAEATLAKEHSAYRVSNELTVTGGTR